jgi:inosine-uridine nucleoside N-ribohydrolase
MMSAPIFVDTDTGVDDAAAIAWLLRAARVVGFSTVFGNSTVEDATRNLLTLLDAAGRRAPVAVGAAAPLVGPRPRTGALVHGPDGFWGAQGSYDLSALPHDGPAAIAAAARAHRDLVLVALGPLTNVALAAQRFPRDMAGVRLVALGGAWRGGNTTPVAEFNAFADPHALERVLASGMRVELITMDAFDRVVVDPAPFLAALVERGGAVGALLARVLGPYFESLHEFDTAVPSLPDVAAAIHALHPEPGAAVPALVRVITAPGYAYGQTIIGATPADRLRLVVSDEELNALADEALASGRDLAAAIRDLHTREPDNALVVRDADGGRMVELLLATLCE